MNTGGQWQERDLLTSLAWNTRTFGVLTSASKGDLFTDHGRHGAARDSQQGKLPVHHFPADLMYTSVLPCTMGKRQGWPHYILESTASRAQEVY